MPEIHFRIRWPDGSEETCYSPSLVIKTYFTPGEDYDLSEFVGRARKALQIASERVQAKFGFPCSRALGQLERIEIAAATFQTLDQPKVQVLDYLEP
ncbi:MAG: MSMEG_0570 family nitrogen starvation response protein [Synechococcaceae cyanobacterium SM2_3_1]|nr:MSMEG_0570 family nitrogen starvation response protein [Synechococcaceae cyanobacterium SM2_3_1]